jgi:hypothetical protein
MDFVIYKLWRKFSQFYFPVNINFKKIIKKFIFTGYSGLLNKKDEI